MTFEEWKNEPAQLLPLSGSAVEDHASIPVWRKFALDINEASEYFGIGQTILRDIVRQHGDSFVIRVRKKILIDRQAFEEYLKEHRHL